ncbi:protein kinase domain-containing protein [Mycobacteroides abscessus]|uniref:protein kinase domain-containing protein n=1 Tax=Mycobacteroides abscessus TaxID=36809 RepID=UPI0019D137E7|nr:protein kinase [Mycobacteroides abscessus]MBN7560203.1 serine/threonine-protein kinase [Mycobacteroides abscessus subsp. abscessus]
MSWPGLKGERLDKATYQFLETISEGNTAQTYKCWHEIFECEVVQKTVSLLGLNDALALSEPGLLNKIKDNNLVEVWEAQWTPNVPSTLKCITFTMPFYREGSLYSVLENRSELSLHHGIIIATQLLKAMHYLHIERRILHRDIKPGNIFLGSEFEAVYLGDLGNAAYMDDTGCADANGGTRLYRPPELATERYSSAGDIYSAGFTMLELFGGLLDYAKLDNKDIEKRLNKGQRAVADRYFRLGPAAPTRLERLIASMTSRDPGRRPPSAAAALRQLGKTTYIDWQPADPAGHREGFWPPTAPHIAVAIEERAIKSGPDAGRREVTVLHRALSSTSWRRISRLSGRVDVSDMRARRAIYDATTVFCAKRWPVR